MKHFIEFEKLPRIPGFSDDYRRDARGNIVCRQQYGIVTADYGWGLVKRPGGYVAMAFCSLS